VFRVSRERLEFTLKRASSVIAILVVACASAMAQRMPAIPNECSPMLDRALELSGFNDAARAMPEQVQRQIEEEMQSDEEMPAETRAKLAGIARGAFAAPAIVLSVKRNLMKDCDVPMLQSAVEELQSRIARRIREEEALSLTPEAQKQVREFYANLKTNPPAASRIAVLERMDKSLSITDSTLDMILAISKGLVAGFGGKWGAPVEVDAMKQQYRESIHNAMIANQLFTYRNVSDEDLGNYVLIYETPSVHKFSGQLQQSMLQAMLERSEAMAREFRTYLAKKPSPAPKTGAPRRTAPRKAAPKQGSPQQ